MAVGRGFQLSEYCVVVTDYVLCYICSRCPVPCKSSGVSFHVTLSFKSEELIPS